MLHRLIASIQDGRAVGFIGAVVMHDGTCNFFAGGLAAEFPSLAHDMATRLHDRAHALIQ